jgi:hypothetical protein
VSDPEEDEYDDFDDDPEEDDIMDECGLGRDGQCSMAGSEHCDFTCPMRNSEFYAGSKAWNRKHKITPRDR